MPSKRIWQIKTLFVSLFIVLLFSQQAFAAGVARAKDYSLDDPAIDRIEVLGAENSGGDPTALIGGFTADGACLNYVFDDSKTFSYSVRLAYFDDADNVLDLPIIAVGPNTPATGVDASCGAVNAPPVANDDSYGTDYSGKNVLSNDTDPDGDQLTAVLQTSPQKGSLNLSPNGSFVYTPNEGATGDDSFTYFANDGEYDSLSAATVLLTIPEVPNELPVANDDAYGADYSGKNVLSNDTDADGDSLTAKLDSSPAHGQLALNADGTFTYTPNDDYVGDDSFTYFANDGTSDSATAALVSLTVSDTTPPPENRAPVAVPDPFGSNYTGKSVLANDSDPDGDTLTAVLEAGASNGVVVLNANGTFTYTPDEGYIGDDSFSYVANDGELDSNIALVSITITDEPPEANQPPVAMADPFGENYVGKNVLSNDSDPEGDALNAILVTGASNGEVVLRANGSFTYTPNPGYSGNDFFTYVANDGELSSNVARVSLTVKSPSENLPPVAVPDSFGENYEGKSVLANDRDPNGDALIAIKVSDPESGELTLNQDGTFVYKPYAGFTGEASFTYKARDRALDNPEGLESAVVSVRLTVAAESQTGLTDKEDADGYSVLGNASRNEINVSNRIDEMCSKLKPQNEGQQDLKQLCTRLRSQGTTARQAVEALGAITPDELEAVPQVTRVVTLMRARSLAARLGRVRGGDTGVSLAGLTVSHGDTLVSGTALDSMLKETLGLVGGGGASGDDAIDFGNLGIFLQGDLSFGDQDDTPQETGFDYDAQNFTLGADYRFTNNVFAGASVSYAWADIDFNKDSGKTETDTISMAAFGSYYTDGGLYFDGIASYAWSDVKTRRKISYTDYFGSVDREAKGDTDGTEYYVSLNAGYGFRLSGFNLDPALSFLYLKGDIDGFKESGAGGWNLAVEDQDFTSTTLGASFQVSYPFTPAWGVFSPYARIEYTREFEDNADGIVFRFVNDPDAGNSASNIRIKSQDPDSNFMMYSAGVTAQFKYGISGFVSYQLLGSYDNLSSEMVSFGARWESTF